MLVMGLASVFLNWTDPTTVKRALNRMTDRSGGNKPSVKGTLIVAALLVIGVAAIDYLFDTWVSSEIARCTVDHRCGDQAAQGHP